MMRLKLFIVAGFAIMVLSGAEDAAAHGLGASFEQEVGGVHVDIGYDPPLPHGSDRMVFDFGIYDAERKLIPFEYVWVRIEMNGILVFATGLSRAEMGPTTLLYRLPDDVEGEMEISARFQDGETEQADVSFEIPVARGVDAPYPWYFVAASGGALGVCVTVVGGAFYLLYKRRTFV